MKNVKEIEIEGERVYLKNGFTGWRTIFPLKNPDGSFNWFNFVTGGAWGKLIILTIIIAFILISAWAYNHDTTECRQVIHDYSLLLQGIQDPDIPFFNVTNYTHGQENPLSLPPQFTD